jgi:cysteinyl-tRNA synthetase
MALQNQYRENFNFTFERLQAAINTIVGFDEMLKRLWRYVWKFIPTEEIRNNHGKLKFHEITREFRDNQQYFMQEFIEKLENDFDTVSAMTVVFQYQSYINSGIDDELFSLEEGKSLIELLKVGMKYSEFLISHFLIPKSKFLKISLSLLSIGSMRKSQRIGEKLIGYVTNSRTNDGKWSMKKMENGE